MERRCVWGATPRHALSRSLPALVALLAGLCAAPLRARADAWWSTDLAVAGGARVRSRHVVRGLFGGALRLSALFGRAVDNGDVAWHARVGPLLGISGGLRGEWEQEVALSAALVRRSGRDGMLDTAALVVTAGAQLRLDDHARARGGVVVRASYGWRGPMEVAWKVGTLGVFVEYRFYPDAVSHEVLAGVELNVFLPVIGPVALLLATMPGTPSMYGH